MSDFPQIFTFYSFKGGVGRSMAVLNLAYALAAQRRHVLILDMDLEAPGLSGFLYRAKEIPGFARCDMVDLVQWASKASLPVDPLSFPPLSDHFVPITRDNSEDILREVVAFGRLDIIPVDEDREYYDRLAGLGMGNCDQNDLVRIGSVLRAWLKSHRFPIAVPDYYGPNVERTAAYDYVLIDSRTGITETGGLCVGPLSDKLVVITALNDQNVEGTGKFLKAIGIVVGIHQVPPDDSAARHDSGPRFESKPHLIVASLVPVGEIDTKRERQASIKRILGKVDAMLSYHPQMALRESIFTRDYGDEYLTREYNDLLLLVRQMAESDGTESLPDAIQEPSSSANTLAILNHLVRSSTPGALRIVFNTLLTPMNISNIKDDNVFILWDRCFRLFASVGESTPFFLSNWADLLRDWGVHSTVPELASMRFEAAVSRYGQILQNRKASSAQKYLALFGRGIVHGQRGEAEKEIADYSAAIQMPDIPNERKASVLSIRGEMFAERGEVEKAIDDYSAVIQMPDAPIERKARAHANRGWAYYLTDRYTEAIEDGRQAILLNPSDSRAHGSLAIALLINGLTSDALKTYETGLAVADLNTIDDMSNDLREAIEKHGPIPGSEEAKAQIEARRSTLGG